MKILKVSLISVALLLVTFLAAAFILPRVYKDDILAMVKEEAGNNLRAELHFKDLHLSVFRHFPLITVTLEELRLTGVEAFQDYPLLQAQEISLSVSLWDLLASDAPLRIRRFHMETPQIRVLVLENGLANYDITYPDTAAVDEEAEPSTFSAAIKAYSISNGLIRFEDRTLPALVYINGLHHRGSGDFTEVRFDLQTYTQMDTLSVDFDGTTYFRNARLELDAGFGVDMEQMAFTLRKNSLRINELTLLAEGMVAMPGDDIDMDLRFSAPSNELRELWSIIPGAYTADFDGLKTSGTFGFDFWMKGRMNEELMPSFGLTTQIRDGRIQYPALPLPIEQIGLDLSVQQPGQSLEALLVDMPMFRLQINGQPINGELYLRDPMTDPDLKARLEGTLDLQDLQKAFPVEAAALSGRIAANLRMAARMSALDQGRYDDVDMQGEVRFADIRFQGEGQPLLQVQQGLLLFSPQYVDARDFQIQAGKSDLQLSARVDNILAFIHPERTLKGRMTLRSQLLDLNEWQSAPADVPPATEIPQEEDMAIGLPTEQFDLGLDARFERLLASDLDIRQLVIRGAAGPTSLKAEELSGKLGVSDFQISGQLEQLFAWMTGDGILKGNIDFKSRLLDLNELMPAEEAATPTAEEAYAPIPVPADIQVRTQARIDQLRYTNLTLRNFDGTLAIGDQIILVEDCRMDGLGGRIMMAGSYDARDLNKPGFHFKYDLQQLDFPQVFAAINTFQALAPVGKYLTGRFSSDLVIDGLFDQQMTPILSSIDATGYLETFNAVIKGFKPLEGLAEKLNIAELKTMDLKNSRNWFEINDGTLELKDFDYQYKDIAMVIGGKHSLDKDMDYLVRARIPRTYLDKTGLTASANTGLKWLEGEAARKGLKVSMGEFVNMAIQIGGTMAKPTYNLKLLGTEGEGGAGSLEGQLKDQAIAAGEKIKDSLSQLAKGKIEEAKEEVKRQAEAKVDTLKKQAEAQIDTALARAKEEAAKKIGDEAAKKMEELGGEKGKQEADKLKEKMKSWDPLKKKKD